MIHHLFTENRMETVDWGPPVQGIDRCHWISEVLGSQHLWLPGAGRHDQSRTSGCKTLCCGKPPFGNGPNTVSVSTVSSTELSEFSGPRRVPGRELSELLSAYYLCAKANSPSFFFAELTKFAPKLSEAQWVLFSETVLLKQYSARFLPLVAPYCALPRDYLSDTPLFRSMRFLVSQNGQLGAILPPPCLTLSPVESMRSGGAIPPPLKRGISAILARYPMKTRQMGARPPSAIVSRKGIARYGGVSRTGPLPFPTLVVVFGTLGVWKGGCATERIKHAPNWGPPFRVLDLEAPKGHPSQRAPLEKNKSSKILVKS